VNEIHASYFKEFCLKKDHRMIFLYTLLENIFNCRDLYMKYIQWASFSKKLQKLIILNLVHIFSIPIQGIGNTASGIRMWKEKFRKSLFPGSKRLFCGFDHYHQPN
jgi:hypothetical protein